MIKIRCKNCNVELDAHPTKTKSCGCPNLTTIKNDQITANDLKLVEIISGNYHKKTATKSSLFTSEDLQWQESRKSRKIKKLEFEIR
jgi:hypothetical protein